MWFGQRRCGRDTERTRVILLTLDRTFRGSSHTPAPWVHTRARGHTRLEPPLLINRTAPAHTAGVAPAEERNRSELLLAPSNSKHPNLPRLSRSGRSIAARSYRSFYCRFCGPGRGRGVRRQGHLHFGLHSEALTLQRLNPAFLGEAKCRQHRHLAGPVVGPADTLVGPLSMIVYPVCRSRYVGFESRTLQIKDCRFGGWSLVAGGAAVV